MNNENEIIEIFLYEQRIKLNEMHNLIEKSKNNLLNLPPNDSYIEKFEQLDKVNSYTVDLIKPRFFSKFKGALSSQINLLFVVNGFNNIVNKTDEDKNQIIIDTSIFLQSDFLDKEKFEKHKDELKKLELDKEKFVNYALENIINEKNVIDVIIKILDKIDEEINHLKKYLGIK